MTNQNSILTVTNGISNELPAEFLNSASLFEAEEEDDELDDTPLNSDLDDDNKIPDWNLISAFDETLEACHRHGGKVGDGKRGASAMHYLTKRLQMTEMQIMVIAMLIDKGQAMSWAGMGYYLGISRLSMMTYTEEVEELVNDRRWLVNRVAREHGCNYEGFGLVPGVIRAVRHDEVFVPEDLSGLSEQEFVERITSKIQHDANNDDVHFEETERWLHYLVEENSELPLCNYILNMDGDIHNRCLLLVLVADYAQCAGRPNEGLSMRNVNSFFPEDWECEGLRRQLTNGTHELMEKGYVEFKCEDGIADPYQYVITQKAKDELLPEFKPLVAPQQKKRAEDRDLLHHEQIKEKALYYNANEGRQMERLSQILSQEQLPEIQKRLSDKGMRTGVAVLLCGGPGTGKTESVRQLARQTGRDLLMIDISQIKDKFVGESEKNTKAIFDRYAKLCKSSAVAPILFINECDAILGKRSEKAEHSADKMQNSMQNILLQALEDLEGVIICTTNLAQSLDPAFERRFLMKVEFEKPDATVRAHIWQSMIPTLTEAEARTLAERYAFSGGQCENVMRKATIEEIINGTRPTLELLDAFCKEETLLQKSNIHPIIGFAA